MIPRLGRVQFKHDYIFIEFVRGRFCHRTAYFKRLTETKFNFVTERHVGQTDARNKWLYYIRVGAHDGRTQSTRCPTLHLIPPFCPTPSTVLKLFPSASFDSTSRSSFILILCWNGRCRSPCFVSCVCLLHLGQSIAVHFDFVLKRTVLISLFRFVCVLESLSSLFLLCIFSHSFNYTCLLINLECSSFGERVGFFEVFWFQCVPIKVPNGFSTYSKNNWACWLTSLAAKNSNGYLRSLPFLR
jgi:hypothetical protein